MSIFDTFFNIQWIGLGSVPEFIIEFFLWLDSIIYSLVGTLMEIFMNLASVDYIFDLSEFQYIIDRIYVLLGVVILFIVAINLLQYVINPDRDDGKSLKNIAFNVVRALILVVLTPVVFDVLYDVQNTIISYNVLPRLFLSDELIEEFNSTDEFNISVDTSGLNDVTEDDNGTSNSEGGNTYSNKDQTYSRDDVMDALAVSYGNQMGWYIYSGFFHEDEASLGSEYNISERLGDEHGWAGWATGLLTGALVIGGAIAIGALTISTGGIGGAILGGLQAFVSGHALTLGIAAGTAVGVGVNNIVIDTENFTFEMLKQTVLMGQWDMITAFAPFVQDGSINYLFLLSTLAGCFLVYVIFSFCLDLGLRALKLIFYQIVAPISFLLSIIPGKENLIKNWFMAVGTTWLEIFVRISCICLIVVGTKTIGTINLSGNSFFVNTILMISILVFVKMIPKLFSDITGIKSGEMKLGIKEKLNEVPGLMPLAKKTTGAGMTLGKKVVSGIDAKKNGLSFKDGWKRVESNGPLAKYKKWKANLLPYSYANAEDKKKADEEYKETQVKIRKGKELLRKHGSSEDYIRNLKGDKYKELQEKFDKRASAKKNMIDWENELAAAKASGDVNKIAEANKNYNDAQKVYELYDKEFNTILGSSKFSKEKSTFDSMKYVEDSTKTVNSVPNHNPNRNVYRAGNSSNNNGSGTSTVRPVRVNNSTNNTNNQGLGSKRPIDGNNNARNQEIPGQTSMFDRNYSPDGTASTSRVTPRRVSNSQSSSNTQNQEISGQTNMFDDHSSNN